MSEQRFEWEKNIRMVEPYVPGEQPKEENIIKLNTNENPYGPSPRVQKLMSEMNPEEFKKYPDPTAAELVNALAEYHNVDPSQVFVGVGSDDVLAMCFMTFFNSDKEILFPDITYSFYPVWAEMLRIPYRKIEVKEDFTIDLEDYDIRNGGIVFPNPNAPTSILLGKDKIIKLLDNNKDSIVIVDEAYIDFAPEGSSMIDMIGKYDNLIVVRTFSKSRSMAGMRIGYAVASPRLIKYINDVKYSYNSYTLNTPSIKFGKASVEDEEYFRKTVAEVVKTREWFRDELLKLGFTVPDSSANFVFAAPKDGNAKRFFESAREHGIYFRYFNSPGIDRYLRITIGLKKDMEKVIDFLKDIC